MNRGLLASVAAFVLATLCGVEIAKFNLTFDLIVRDVVLVNPLEITDSTCIAIRRETIVRIGHGTECDQMTAGQVLSYPNQILIPGFINTHSHGGNYALKGYFGMKPPQNWWEKIYKIEQKFLNQDVVRAASYLNAVRFMEGGITTTNDMYYFPLATADGYRAAGLRAIVSESVGQLDGPSYSTYDQAFKEIYELFDHLDGRTQVRAGVSLHGSYVPLEKIGELLRYSKSKATVVSMHYMEWPQERSFLNSRGYKNAIEFLNNAGLANQTLLVHGTYLTPEEISQLAKMDIGISLNLTSNLNLNRRIPRVQEMLSNKLVLGIGTDGAVTNPEQSFFAEFKEFPSGIPAQAIFIAATSGGARALKMEKEIGSIEVGKRADFVVFSQQRASGEHSYEEVLQESESQIAAVYVGGKKFERNENRIREAQEVISNWRESF